MGFLPNWVGFGVAIIAGIVCIAVGASISYAGLIAIGAWMIIASIIAFVSGAKASPEVNPFKKSFGATVKEIDQVPWIIIAILLVAAVVIAVVTAP
jgi:hypothetical protein